MLAGFITLAQPSLPQENCFAPRVSWAEGRSFRKQAICRAWGIAAQPGFLTITAVVSVIGMIVSWPRGVRKQAKCLKCVGGMWLLGLPET